ncbi:MAG: head GIN domain-containing protein [Gelidibacter sp.]
MSTLIKIIVTSILSLTLVSCSFNLGVKGNGNVVTKERTIDGSFDQIQVSRGLDVYLTQSETESLTVQADENLHDIIITKIEGNVLKIYADKNIRYATTQKVMVNFKSISKISTSSGSDIYSTGIISADNLELESASGSHMDLDLNVNSLECKASSGSDLKIKGTANQLFAKASSGSAIDATHLTTLTTNATSSSGADIVVNVSKELTAKAESGGAIKYLGNPEKVNTSGSVSGSVKQQ